MLQVSRMHFMRDGNQTAAPCSQIYTTTDLQHLPLSHPESHFGVYQGTVPHQPPHLHHGQSRTARGTGASPIPGTLSPAEVLLCTSSCSAASLLLWLGFFPLCFHTSPSTFPFPHSPRHLYSCNQGGRKILPSYKSWKFFQKQQRETFY